MDLQELREKMNRIDRDLVDLYLERMETAQAIGAWKRENGVPVYDPARERELMDSVAAQAGGENEDGVRAMFSFLVSQSRTRQLLDEGKGSIGETIRRALESTPNLFPEKAEVACQGVEGAYSQQACEKIFRHPSITYFRSFADVFDAIESGKCRYGVLPIENSLAGSVNAVYDLMAGRRFHIVRSTRIKIDHTLLTLPEADEADIREVFSHEQAIHQCSEYLGRHPEWRVTPCTNTAAAASMVSKSGRKDAAAISSARCAALYGLKCVDSGIQNNSNNHTRFICISRDAEIYPGADKTTLLLALPNRPGELYRILSLFNAQGVNLTKLESRPMPGRDFEFMFCFDIDASVYSPAFTRLMDILEVTVEHFTWLGSYTEQA
ncbi:MAG: prephenate dehydratase [Clostridiales bacterium]|nr:prephenate dehydratase [Clostridiales bacterium]